jgi:hypothetical protein
VLTHQDVNARRTTIETTRKRARIETQKATDDTDFNFKKLQKPAAR